MQAQTRGAFRGNEKADHMPGLAAWAWCPGRRAPRSPPLGTGGQLPGDPGAEVPAVGMNVRWPSSDAEIPDWVAEPAVVPQWRHSTALEKSRPALGWAPRARYHGMRV